MTYRAPINDMLLALNHGAGLEAAVKAGHYGDFDADITAAVLEEAGKFASDVLAPLNRVGELHDAGTQGPAAGADEHRPFRAERVRAHRDIILDQPQHVLQHRHHPRLV